MQQHLIENQHACRQPALSLSEIMTIVVYFHQARFRDFKTYYNTLVRRLLRRYFPEATSYTRFVELMPRTILPLCAYLNPRKSRCTGVAFIDSTALAVCPNRRIHQHKTFQGLAQRGKMSVGYFYGFKLHVVVNDRGERLGVSLTPGNCDDRAPVPALCWTLFGLLVGDKGYLSQALSEALFDEGVRLVTKLRRNMKHRLLRVEAKFLLRKRALIECVFDHLKNICQIEHSRHRSATGFAVNLLSGLVAYTFSPRKPSLNLEVESEYPMIF